MGFVLIEEWGDKENLHRWHSVPIFAGTFGTKEEADEEAKKHEPEHGGIIRAVPDNREGQTVPKRKGRRGKKPRLREIRRRSGR
jgi:hypothetical protein